MPLVASIRTGFQNYFVYKNRARRADFWWWFGFIVVGEVILSSISTNAANAFSLVTFIPHVMFGIRRLHDTNRSGWWWLVPIVNLVFWAQPGNEGENRFGPPPPPATY